VGASTASFRRFLAALGDGASVEVALDEGAAPAAARAFVGRTMEVVDRGRTVEVLASFLFGREDLIPEMFGRLLPRWERVRVARRFAYYVERHIDLDGGDHGPAGERALVELLGRDAAAWRAAERAAGEAIGERIRLWDGIAAAVAAMPGWRGAVSGATKGGGLPSGASGSRAQAGLEP